MYKDAASNEPYEHRDISAWTEDNARWRRLKAYLVSEQALGQAALVGVLVLWAVSGIITKDILSTSYNKPFLMTYTSVAALQVYFIFFAVKDPLLGYLKLRDRPVGKVSSLKEMPQHRIARVAAVLFMFYVASLYCSNTALIYTSLSSQSTLSSTNSLFTLLLGSLCGVEAFSWIKGGAVTLTFLGVVVNNLPAESQAVHVNTLLGNMIAVVGAFSYANVIVWMQKLTANRAPFSRPLLFAYMGCFSMLTTWPLFIVLDWAGVEPFALPPTSQIAWNLFWKTLLGSVLPMYLWTVAFAFTSPLYIALGSTLNIPMTLAVDYLFLDQNIRLPRIVGAALILSGCMIINLARR
jgi:solute carrier family 35 protein F5